MTSQRRRTRRTEAWILPSDSVRFGDLVRAEAPGVTWRCSHPGPAASEPRHLHESIAEALACSGDPTDVRTSLPFGANPYVDEGTVLVQLTLSRVLADDLGRHLRSGVLATTWSVGETAGERDAQIAEQRDLLWSLFGRATSAARVTDLGGRPLTGLRVGPDAHDLVRSEGLLLARAGPARFRFAASG